MGVRRRAALIDPPRTGAFYTAQDVARFCEVDLKTVHHWADRDKVAHFRTEGRHLRFRRNDVVRFLCAHGYPIPTELASVRPSVAVASAPTPDGTATLDDLTRRLSPKFAVRTYPSAAVAIAHLVADAPDAIVASADDPSWSDAHTIAALKGAAPTAWITIAVVGVEERTALARAAGAEICVAPTEIARLPGELMRTLAIA